MALHEITQIGYTESGIDTLVSAEASLKDIGDNALISKINSKLIDRDAQNKELTERNTEAINIMDAAINNTKQSRYATVGPVEVEPTAPNNDLTTKINAVAQFFDDKKSIFTGLDSTASLTAKKDAVDAQEILNEARITDIESNINPNSFKEVYDHVMGTLSETDPNTVIGFETKMRRDISKLADNAAQEKGKCLVYKDENSKTFYELYIQGGLITLEEVYNPLKDIIQAYLVNKEFYFSKSDDKQSYIVMLDNHYFIVYRVKYSASNNIVYTQVVLFRYDDLGIQEVQTIEDSKLFGASPISDFGTTNATKMLKVDNNILFYGQGPNDSYTLSVLYHSIVKYDNVTSTIAFSTGNSPLDTMIGQNPSIYLGKYGNCVNSNYIFMTDTDRKVNIYSRASGILFNSININNGVYINRDGQLFTQTPKHSIVCDESYVYCLTTIGAGGNGISSLRKYNIADQSLISHLDFTGSEYDTANGRIWMVNGKIAIIFGALGTQKLYFIDPITMTVIPDGEHDFAPIQFSTSNISPGEVDVKDLGNSKMLIIASVPTIFSYDGYMLYTTSINGVRTIAMSDETLITMTGDLGNYNLTYKTKPIYK